ncbi:MAG: hypothetical protein R3D65_08120 [Zhengella sp.]|uniref:hypothetical protein n=1 Tax=Zhengella sp. TaxID=2282762 RepID=UPI001DF14328|nr:hypothetical protein [Notoacmeibacter sp.]MCC0025679.1 hypothetical protein [Brucellaceae bacterium]
MKLEPIETHFTDVLDGVAFSMGCAGMRVIVIVTNGTLVRMGLPEKEELRAGFLAEHRSLWQEVASSKFERGDYENRGSRVRIMPRDMAIVHFSQAS